MSNESFGRFANRENKIWHPFIYSFQFSETQTTDRGIIYGLYSGSYLNNQSYLAEIETDALSNLLNDYHAKMTELTTQEQLVVADIVSKRYLSSIDQIIHDQKMTTKTKGIEADDELWTAKIAALSADQAALETMAERVTSETQKTAAKITEIETYIEIEAIRLAETDIEIAEKEITSSKVDLQKLGVANEILKIQIDTVQAAQKLVDIDTEIARTKINSADIDRSISKIGLLAGELLVEQAKTTAAQAEIPVAENRADLAEDRTTAVDDESAYITGTLIPNITEEETNKKDLMDAKDKARTEAIKQNRAEKDLALEQRLDLYAQDETFANTDQTAQAALDAAKIVVINQKAMNQNMVRAAETAGEILMANAVIQTSITHFVKKNS